MTDLQKKIATQLHVQTALDPAKTIEAIVTFLADYLRTSNAKGYILGISGGQDSSLCGRLAQLAVQRFRDETGKDAQFWALRLPYGVQKDEADAKLALSFIQPDRALTLNIQQAVLASAAAFEQATGSPLTDYHRGNVKARERMVEQYAIAGQHGMLVLGTDHAAEAVTGFFTKFGDGACDLTPLTGLTKRQGKALLQHLSAPARLYQKVPTADLEDLKPQVADEVALGLTYAEIDRYLEGESVDETVAEKIEAYYLASQHKRSQPVNRFESAS